MDLVLHILGIIALVLGIVVVSGAALLLVLYISCLTGRGCLVR